MQVIALSKRDKIIKVIPETLEDLWVLEKVISPGDVVSGVVLRRMKREGERGSGEVHRVFVRIRVEDVKFHEYSKSLRVGGIVIEARPERFIGKGKHQTIEVRPGREVTVEKAEWDDFLVDEIRRAERESKIPKHILVAMDDEGATVCTLGQRVERVGYVRNPNHGKRGGASDLRQYYGDLLAFLEQLEPELVIVGGPGFFHDDFVRFAKERGSKKKYRSVSTSVAGMKGIHEIIADYLEDIVQEHHLSKIASVLSEFLKRLSKGEPVAVGPEVPQYAEMGAVEALLMTDEFFLKNRESARRILDAVRHGGGSFFIVPRGTEEYSTVAGLGGVIALLRYR